MSRACDFLKNHDSVEPLRAAGSQPPAMAKPPRAGSERIALAARRQWSAMEAVTVLEAIAARRSRRKFGRDAISREHAALLLWATQGVQRDFGDRGSFRAVPSAGARHALETYIVAQRIDSVPAGIYHYLPFTHQLEFWAPAPRIDELLAAVREPAGVGQAAAIFVWAAVPARMEWRYAQAAAKLIALDAGHVCQNLYLACQAIACGCCAVAAYDQQKLDALLGLDGRDEFAVYLAAVGRSA